MHEGKTALERIIFRYQLCPKLSGINIAKSDCFNYKTKQCDGACIGKITPEEYNFRVQEFIDKNSFENQNMVLVDRGRSIGEHSAVLIENGNYKGFCFYDLNYQIHRIEILKNIIVPMENNRDVKYIIQSYMRKSKSLKIITF